MDESVKQKLNEACWIAKQLFDHRMGPGTTGNLSFYHEGVLYITASGSCFGNLKPADFTVVNMADGRVDGHAPSKELPLHRIVYEAHPQAQAVIHVHSTYAVLWSLLDHDNENDCIPSYTPYLKMKMGNAALVPYAKPGSPELFDAFRQKALSGDGWLLKNHGPVVKGKSLMDAFAIIEELEDACRIAWEVKDLHIPEIKGE